MFSLDNLHDSLNLGQMNPDVLALGMGTIPDFEKI